MASKGLTWWVVIAAVLLGVLVFWLGPTLVKFDYTEIGTRASWQLPNRVVASLALAPGAVVADIGAGDGYFTFFLARAVSDSGRVFAVDIDAGIVQDLRAAARREGASNVEAILAKLDDPELPDRSVDLAFICNVYHHIERREEYFQALRRDLVPGGRVAIIEMTDQMPLRWLGPPGHWTPLETLQREMQEAGYRMVGRHDFLPLQSFLLFESVDSTRP